MASRIPDGAHTLTTHLIVKGASEAIDFYKQAFGAVEIMRMPAPKDEGKLMHASLQIGDSRLFLADEFPEHGLFGPAEGGRHAYSTIHLYVGDADEAFGKAVEAGATVTMPLADMFWGDRYGKIIDPFGHHWSIAHHLEGVTAGQMAAATPECVEA